MFKLKKQTDANLNRFLVWIDGVGVYLVCLNDRFEIGGARFNDSDEQADLALMSNLSRQHASIIRNGSDYLVESHGSAKLSGREIVDQTHLLDGNEITLSESVKLRFYLPSALSSSARIDFLSDHRPPQPIDGVVLMAETCLLGAGTENHVPCPNWPGTVLLVRRGDEVWCQSRLDIFVNEQHIPDGCVLNNHDIITGSEIRFHIEKT